MVIVRAIARKRRPGARPRSRTEGAGGPRRCRLGLIGCDMKQAHATTMLNQQSRSPSCLSCIRERRRGRCDPPEPLRLTLDDRPQVRHHADAVDRRVGALGIERGVGQQRPDVLRCIGLLLGARPGLQQDGRAGDDRGRAGGAAELRRVGIAGLPVQPSPVV